MWWRTSKVVVKWKIIMKDERYAYRVKLACDSTSMLCKQRGRSTDLFAVFFIQGDDIRWDEALWWI